MLRVATYNIRHGVGAGGRFDARAMVEACRSLDADVLALNEVDQRSIRTWFCHEPRRIGAATGLHPHFATTRWLGPLGRYGLALLTRGAPVGVDEVALPASRQRRVAIVADVDLAWSAGERALTTVVATHLQNDEAVAADQLDALLRHLERRPGSDRPVLVLGDLNLEADAVLPRLRAAGFVAADTGPSFPASSPRRRFDWIAGRGIAFDAASVVALDASDHRPVVASARLSSSPYGS